MEELLNQINLLKGEIDELRLILFKKSGLGSADIRGKIKSGSTVVLGTGDINSAGMFGAGVVDQAAIGADAVGDSELKYEVATVTISAGNPSGTATVTSGSIILGWYPQTNLDQIIDDISVSGTTLTVTLAGNATATTTIKVNLIKV